MNPSGRERSFRTGTRNRQADSLPSAIGSSCWHFGIWVKPKQLAIQTKKGGLIKAARERFSDISGELPALHIAAADVNETQQANARHGEAAGFGNGSQIEFKCAGTKRWIRGSPGAIG